MPIRRTWVLALALLIATAPMSSLATIADVPSLSGLGGEELTGADLESGEVILVIWATWSPRCRDIVRRVNSLARNWSPRARVATVVFQEDAEVVGKFLAGESLAGESLAGQSLAGQSLAGESLAGESLAVPVYLDTTGSFSKRFAVTTLPGLLVVKDGEAEFQGKLPLNPNPVIERAFGKKP